MKVRDLIEKLQACNPDAEVVFHENMECDGLMDIEFTMLKHVTPGYAMDMWMDHADGEIAVYEAAGVHSQGYKINTPIIALSSTELIPVETNATVRSLSGRVT